MPSAANVKWSATKNEDKMLKLSHAYKWGWARVQFPCIQIKFYDLFTSVDRLSASKSKATAIKTDTNCLPAKNLGISWVSSVALAQSKLAEKKKWFLFPFNKIIKLTETLVWRQRPLLQVRRSQKRAITINNLNKFCFEFFSPQIRSSHMLFTMFFFLVAQKNETEKKWKIRFETRQKWNKIVLVTVNVTCGVFVTRAITASVRPLIRLHTPFVSMNHSPKMVCAHTFWWRPFYCHRNNNNHSPVQSTKNRRKKQTFSHF